MDSSARLRSWTPRLLFFSVLGILVLVGVIQYQWFSRSAAVEIEGTLRGLESGLRQTVFREYQRYAPLMTSLKDFLKQEGIAFPRAKAFLEAQWATYGAQGEAPGLVSWVGISGNDPNQYRELVPGSGWVSKEWPEAPWKDPPPPLGATGDKSGVLTLVLDFPVGARSSVLLARREVGPSYLFGLNPEEFFNSYIRPSVAETMRGVDLTWETVPRDNQPPVEFNPEAYSFNPLEAVLGGASVPRTLSVAVPRFIGLVGRNEIRISGTWVLKAVLPPDAPVLSIERRLAWNWLGSTLLLVVLAGAFGLIQRQSGRLADLRRREREFVASVSHELRTPLTVIRSAADNFCQGIVPPEKQGRYGQLILDQSLRLGRMIEEMLAFAQTEAAVSPSPVKALLTFGPWLAELRPPLETLAAERQIQLVWDVARAPLAGRTDPAALRLILDNLVVNALNHAYPPSNTTTQSRMARVTLKYQASHRLELTVEDDGRGISPKEAKKVFEPFYRDQVSRNNQEKGSGLGLFLALRQAKRMGGELRLESPWRRLDGSRRSGCRFTLVVPFTEVDYGG